MRQICVFLSAALMVCSFAISADRDTQRQMPTAGQVQDAIKAGRLVNGMTFKQASAAMKPAKADVTRADGKIVAAVWVLPSSGSEADQWACDVDPDMTVWNVRHSIVQQEQKSNARADRIRNVRQRQRGN